MTVIFVTNAKINSHYYQIGEVYSLGATAETTAIAAGQAISWPSLASQTFNRVAAATLGAGPYNALGASTILGYIPGVTNQLILTAASGGSTINSIDVTNASNNHTILIENASSTDVLAFPHLAAGGNTQISNQNAGTVNIPALGAARLTLTNGILQFA